MIVSETQIRVNYSETDKMGFCYYGNYPKYYEIGRTELFRELGVSYKDMEDNDILLPVIDLNIKYHKPAHYDDLITVKTILKETPSIKIVFHYEVYNQHNELLNEGKTTLVFMNGTSNRPMKAPAEILEKLSGMVS